MTLGWILAAVAVAWGLAYHRAPLWLWTAAAAGATAALIQACTLASSVSITLWTVFAVVALALNFRPLRRQLFTRPVFALFRKILPAMSDTEREALEAGTVWWEAELFNGKPRWKKLKDVPKAQLSAEEQAFLDGPCEELCRMLDDWEITHERNDLPPKVW